MLGWVILTLLTENIYKDNLYLNIFSQRVRPNDAGFYSCVAGNILGETISRWDLDGRRFNYVEKIWLDMDWIMFENKWIEDPAEHMNAISSYHHNLYSTTYFVINSN